MPYVYRRRNIVYHNENFHAKISNGQIIVLAGKNSLIPLCASNSTLRIPFCDLLSSLSIVSLRTLCSQLPSPTALRCFFFSKERINISKSMSVGVVVTPVLSSYRARVELTRSWIPPTCCFFTLQQLNQSYFYCPQVCLFKSQVFFFVACLSIRRFRSSSSVRPLLIPS